MHAIIVPRENLGTVFIMSDLASPEVLELVNQYIECSNDKKKELLKQKIAAACLPAVKKIARSLARRNTDPIEDLIQVGCVGLLKAIEHYSLSHKAAFKTYANYYITGEIRHYLRDKVSMVRAPRELQELAFRINQIIEQLTKELNRAPTEVEISERLSLPVSKVNEVVQVERRKNHVSLDNNLTFFNTESSLSDFLVDDKYQESLTQKEEKVMLLDAIDMLDPKSRDVIKMSFFQDMNQKQISEEIGVSQMQVSRIIKKALNELAAILTKQWG